jgi:hypothetical protein
MADKNLRAAVLGKRIALVWGKSTVVSSKIYFAGGSALSHTLYGMLRTLYLCLSLAMRCTM